MDCVGKFCTNNEADFCARCTIKAMREYYSMGVENERARVMKALDGLELAWYKAYQHLTHQGGEGSDDPSGLVKMEDVKKMLKGEV